MKELVKDENEQIRVCAQHEVKQSAAFTTLPNLLRSNERTEVSVIFWIEGTFRLFNLACDCK